MRKLLLLLSLLLCLPLSIAAETKTGTIDLTAQGWANAADATTVTCDFAVVSFELGNNTNGNKPKYYTSGTAVRIYAGNHVIVESPSTATLTITAVSAIDTNNKNATCTFTKQDNGSFKFTPTGQSRFQKITVSYEEITVTPDPVDFVYPAEEHPTTINLIKGVDKSYTIFMPEDAPEGIEWNSDNTDVVTVNANKLTVAGAGTAVVKASWSATSKYNEGSIEFTVNVNEPTGPVVYDPKFPASITLVKGDPKNNTCVLALDNNAYNRHPALTFTAAQPGIVSGSTTIDDDGGYIRTITARGIGSTTVTVSWPADDLYEAGSVVINYTVKGLIEAAEFEPASIKEEIDPEQGGTANASFTAIDCDNHEVGLNYLTFTSSDSSVATYDAENGIVNLLAPGQATITAALTEEGAARYVFSDDTTLALNVTVTDINAPLGYELVKSANDLNTTDEYIIAAELDNKLYVMKPEVSSKKIQSIEASYSNSEKTTIALSDDFLKLNLENAASGYYLKTVNFTSPGYYVTNTSDKSTDLNITSSSKAATIAFEKESPQYANIVFEGSRQILLQKVTDNNGNVTGFVFGYYASSNASKSGYGKAQLFRIKQRKTFEYTGATDIDINVGFKKTIEWPAEAPGNITWESSDEEVFTFDAEKKAITALGEGDATLTASWPMSEKYKAGSLTINVHVTQAELVAYDPKFPKSIKLVLGDTDRDYYTFKLDNNSYNSHPESMTFTATPEGILEVFTEDDDNDGITDCTIIAEAAGQAIVKVEWEANHLYTEGSVEIPVYVVENVIAEFNPTSIIKSINTDEGSTAKASFLALDNEANELDNTIFNFTSSNPEVATFDAETGTVALLGVGETTITAALTEESSLRYILSDESKLTLRVVLSDINEPVVYKPIAKLDEINDEDYYAIGAEYNNVFYTLSAGNTNKSKIDAVTAQLDENGAIIPADNILKLKFEKDGTTYKINATNYGENGGYLSATSSGTNLTIPASGAAFSVTFENDFAKIGVGTTRQILLKNNETPMVFGHYANTNTSNSDYNRVKLYRINHVEAEAPIVEEFANKGVGQTVKFTTRHSSHMLQYREWRRYNNPAPRAKMRAVVEEDGTEYDEWTDVAGSTHTHTIKALDEVGDNVAAHGIQVRAIDARGNASIPVGFYYDGNGVITGIEAVGADAANGEVELYNLQGVRVNPSNALPGLYIERRNGKATKVLR